MSALDAFDLMKSFGGGGEGSDGGASPFRIGTIAAGVGGVAVQFDGEDLASAKTYKFLKSYTPAVGDRVLLATVGNSYIILGNF